jgi:hypothetical protein
MTPETMKKIGRNDLCPSGGGGKFKKCLAAHSCLSSQSSAAEIWWVCDRWQAQTPALHELRAALSAMPELDPAKFDAFLEIAFSEPPSTPDFWRQLITACAAKGHPDLPGQFRRMNAHLVATGNPELPWFYNSAAACLQANHPEMLSEMLAATLALDPATTLMESLERLVEWADQMGRGDDCQRLREHFLEFPEYMLMDPEEESTAPTSEDYPKEREPDFPPEVTAALDKAWDDFEALDSPSLEQSEAFIEELLALPHEATNWNDVFAAVPQGGHEDVFKIFHRLAAALAPTRNNDFAFICWAAVESLGLLGAPQRLPEIARTLLEFNPQSCNPDALSHIADALLAHGFVDEWIELMTGFLPSLRDNEDLMDWVLPRVAEEIFLVRLGSLIASGDYSRQPLDQLLAGLCADLGADICESRASVPLQYLMQDGANFTREQFMIPGSTSDSGKRKILWNGLQQALVEVARDEWQIGSRNPAKILIGLHMILQSAESWLASHREKGRKYPPNLLDYLNTAAMDRLVIRECSDLFGVNLDRAHVMLDACVSLVRWTGRRGILAEKEHVKAEKEMAQLLKLIGR